MRKRDVAITVVALTLAGFWVAGTVALAITREIRQRISPDK